ncbi:MAG: N,N-dimethylformamidase, partial [Dongiales bacterium]
MPGSETCRAKTPAAKDVPRGQPFLIGAHLGEQGHSAGHFNGKIEAPCLVAEALAPADLAALLDRPRDFPLLAAWDFAREIETVVIRDVGGRGLHGRAVNLPARGVTGHRWAGRSLSWREAPADYAAIHFHEDDLYD